MSNSSSDFFEPTLDARDDFTGFDQPFEPYWLALVSFFGGPFVAGAMIGWNHAKLGGSKLVAWGWFLLLSIGLFPFMASDRTWGRVVLLALIVAAQLYHRRRYRLYQHSGGEARGGCWLALGVLAVGMVASMVFYLVLMFSAYSLLDRELAVTLIGEENVTQMDELFSETPAESTETESEVLEGSGEEHSEPTESGE